MTSPATYKINNSNVVPVTQLADRYRLRSSKDVTALPEIDCCWEPLEYVGLLKLAPDRHKRAHCYRCRCKRCGAKRILARNQLTQAASTGAKGCSRCNSKAWAMMRAEVQSV